MEVILKLLAVVIIFIQAADFVKSLSSALEVDFPSNQDKLLPKLLSANGAKHIRQKRSCFHSCVKPIVKRFRHTRICQFSPCEPPRGMYYVMADPVDKKCYCYGKGHGIPIRKRGPHEWWKPLPNENKDPNDRVKPDKMGQCLCTIPKVVLDNKLKTVYNDR